MTINGSVLPGVRMGREFANTLLAPAKMKAYIYNNSTLEHGTRALLPNIPKKEERKLNLEFLITGADRTEFYNNYTAFCTELYKGHFDLEVPEVSPETYHLLYLGDMATYSGGLSRCACRVNVSFLEPDPSFR